MRETASDRKVGGGVGVAILVGLGLWAWSKGRGAEAAIAPEGWEAESVAAAAAMVEWAEALTTEQAEAMLASPTEIVSQNQVFVDAYPTAYSMIEQANMQIASGQASAGDILRFEVDKAYYQKYVAEGGTASYEDFTLYRSHWTPEYEAAKQEVKDTVARSRADEAETDYFYVTDGYGNIVGTDPERLATYIDKLSPTNPVRLELESRHPELVAPEAVHLAVKEAEAPAAVTEPLVIEKDYQAGTEKVFDPTTGATGTVESYLSPEAKQAVIYDSDYQAAVKRVTSDRDFVAKSRTGYTVVSSPEPKVTAHFD